MYTDGREVETGSTLTYDICIVGAGAAGISMALSLMESSLSVCVLESGGFSADGETQELYRGRSVGIPYDSLHTSRLRYFGGSTNHWAGWCARLRESDFEERSWVPHTGWPIRRADLDPYYPEAYRLCEIEPVQEDPASWEDPAEHRVRLPLDEAKVTNTVIQVGPPARFGRLYRQDLISSSNVHLITHANMTRMEASASGSTVTGLQVRCLNGNAFQVQAQRYVLACGGIENARLLLLAHEHVSEGLGENPDLIGRFFMESPWVNSATVVLSERMSMALYNRQLVGAGEAIFCPRITKEVQQRRELLSCRFSFIDHYPAYATMRKLFNRFVENPLQFGSPWTDIEDDVRAILRDFGGTFVGLNKRFKDDLPYDNAKTFQLRMHVEQAPNPESRVRLGEERDAFGERRAQLDWQLTDREKRTAVEAHRILAQELGRTGLGRLRVDDWAQETDFDWPEGLRGIGHHIGTTRMSSDPENGVVDTSCKMHGVDNLFIAGSSVFPTSGDPGPTLTIVALALRLADHLEESFHYS